MGEFGQEKNGDNLTCRRLFGKLICPFVRDLVKE